MSQHTLKKIVTSIEEIASQVSLERVEVGKPDKITSYDMTFRVENLLGWEMASITGWCNCNTFEGCDVSNPQKGFKNPSSAFVSIDPLITVSKVTKEKKDCPDGIMGGFQFQFDVTFQGYLNNIPYSNFITMWGDGTMEWGPKS